MTRIRAAEARDAEAVAAIYAPHVADGFVSFETEVPDAEAMRRRMAASDGYYPWIILESDAAAVLGYAYAARFRERAAYGHVVETTIYMAPQMQRSGLGQRLYSALLATLTAQGFTQAMGVIALPNPASVGLHEALGFVKAGLFPRAGYKFGQWVDVGYWQRPLHASTVPAPTVRSFRETGVRLD
ncbi:GNAT family N-acetyltransferase [Sphingosinithalassobacter portus]|uniref:GNAT family N-acetyltransferase n=1 Tax=Stakelama portus TaxID=2676234 RepID=UPI000D6E8FC1|nr:GNAT family N-acetyltransferase [Sphingosinithalassobacter portus]